MRLGHKAQMTYSLRRCSPKYAVGDEVVLTYYQESVQIMDEGGRGSENQKFFVHINYGYRSFHKVRKLDVKRYWKIGTGFVTPV